MKKRLSLFLLLLFCVALLFVVPVYAADSSGDSPWWDAFGWFGDVANFIKYLVVPEENYFHNRLAKLNAMANAKFSGLGQLYQTLNDFFARLASPGSADVFFRIPDNFLYRGFRGFSVDFFNAAAPYINFVRLALTGSFFLFTVVTCYHKLRTFFTEEES